ncbi:hypothetical protein, partial [Cryobacterium sp. TMS1-20-1]|uniref:hypothetical protein n=1 Tax=Cryobacterium sp. TMS1-20-1 TaxID=1259223 RepID=UPI001A7E1239
MNINGKRRITGRTGIAVAVAIIAGTLASFPFGAQSASAESQGAEVVGTETDAAGRTVVLREGTYNGSVGFGWTKIQQRHNIHSKHTIGFVLKAPNGGVQQGEDRLYVALSCCGYLGQWALLKWGVTESRDQHDRIAEKIYPGVQ